MTIILSVPCCKEFLSLVSLSSDLCLFHMTIRVLTVEVICVSDDVAEDLYFHGVPEAKPWSPEQIAYRT